MSKGFDNYQTLKGDKPGDGSPNRNIPSRVADYELLSHMSSRARILDIGCNRGFFGIYLSSKIGSYVGIDHDLKQITHGMNDSKRLGLKNLTYQCVGFEHYNDMTNFDGIFSFAIHAYIKMPMCDYASKMYGMLNPGGRIYLEGHPPGYLGEPKKLNELVDLLEGHFKMKKELQKTVKDRANNRQYYIWKKQQ